MAPSKFDSYATILRKRISVLSSKKQQDLVDVKWSNDVFTRLQPLLVNGKMIRGSTLLAMYEVLSGRKPSQSIIEAACALEILQTALVIHDDILDRSSKRRGKPTLQMQYREILKNHGDNNSHTADMFALCIGDLCFHWADEILASALADNKYKAKVSVYISRELQIVQLAQMTDMDYSGTYDPTDKEILDLYKYKTARYTFAMPLTLAAILSGKNKPTVSFLEVAGEKMGVLFQLVDDDIGIFGSSDVTGKPVFSDIEENKKTLLRRTLLDKAGEGEKSNILSVYGSGNITERDLLYIRTIVVKSGAREAMEELMNHLELELTDLIVQSFISGEAKKLLRQLVYKIRNRKK